MTAPLKQSIHKVGEINKNKRIWIANQSLTKSFKIGDLLDIDYRFNEREIEINKADILSNHSISSRESKTGRTPILDIKNSDVTKLFKDVEKVEVLYYLNRIVIRATKNEKARLERTNKRGLKTAELFAGGGTLSHLFAKEGFDIVFSLEKEENFMYLNELNHTNTRTTILASIEDVHPSDYPTDIDVALVGTPCTFDSKGNIQLTKAMSDFAKGVADEKQLKLLEKKEQNDALVYHALNALAIMNPRTIVYECVEEFSYHAQLLRTILKQRGYHITETVANGSHTNRKRWTLIGNMLRPINLDNLVPESNITIDKLLAVKVEDRKWKTADEIPCFKRAKADARVGDRSKVINEITRTSTFDTHGARGSEPIMKHPTLDLYDKYSNADIVNIHGLDGYKLSHMKSWNRKVLGNGVSDQFTYVARRILDDYKMVS